MAILKNKETCVQNMDEYDRKMYVNVIKKSPVLKNMRDKGEETFPSFPSLQRDLWAGLYKYDPMLKKQVPPELRVNKEIAESVYNLPEFQGLKEITRLDNLASALGILSVEDKIRNIIGGYLSQNKERQKALNNATKTAEKSKLEEDLLKQRLDELLKSSQQQNQKPQQRKERAETEDANKEQNLQDTDKQTEKPNQEQTQPESEPEDGEQQQNKQQNQQQEQKSEGPEEELNTHADNENQNGEEQKGQDGQDEIDQLKQELEKAQKTRQQAEQEAENIATQMASEVKQGMENNKDQLSEAIGKSTNEVLNDLKDIRLLTSQGVGYDSNKGKESNEDVAASIGIAQELKKNSVLKKVANIAGKMKKFAFSKKKGKVTSTARQRVETGNDVERLVPNELLLFNTPETNQYFLKRYSESECLQYSKKTKDKAGKGPIVCCIDVSGSMGERLTQTELKEEWAKGVAFALYSIAMRDKRAFHLIEFDDCIVSNYQIKKKETQKILELLTPKSLNGTDFYKPLYTALKIISSEKIFKKADIIFITDGECSMNNMMIEKITKEKKRTKTSILSIQLDARAPSSTLEEFSDLVIRYDGSDEFTKVFEI